MKMDAKLNGFEETEMWKDLKVLGGSSMGMLRIFFMRVDLGVERESVS